MVVTRLGDRVTTALRFRSAELLGQDLWHDPRVPVSSLELARFKRLAVRASDVWQGGIVRLPMWIQEKDDDPPYRPNGVFWFSTRTGLIWTEAEQTPNSAGVDLAVRGLMTFAKKYDRDLMGRPAMIEVTDAALAEELRAALDDRDTTIAVVRDLPNVRDALRAMELHQNDGEPVPGALLDSPGVTLDGLRGFADAAARFYQANVWDKLSSDEDLVSIESPVVDPALQHLVITGSTRALRGLTFFSSPQQFERFLTAPPTRNARKPSIWILSFDPIDWMPFGDVDAWIDHALPVAAPDAYPRPGRIEGDDGLARPDGAQLAFLETVLRALAESTDDDFDSGRWTRRVETVSGPVDVRMSLPRMLDAIAAEADPGAGNRGRASQGQARVDLEQTLEKMRQAMEASGASSIDDATRIFESMMASPPEEAARRDPNASPATPLEQAQELAYAAIQATGRYQVHLARRALALSPDCADAWSVLGDRAPGTAAALPFYREAMAAGERALGPAYFKEHAGDFWGLLETRPYMRARYALAETLEIEDQFDEAIDHFRELIRLNPGDNQGARSPLLVLLLEEGRDADAKALIAQIAEDVSPGWLYAGALVAFRLQEADADDRLRAALSSNRHVPPFLSGEKEIPEPPPAYRIGSVEEAAIAAEWLIDVWTETPGALFWLNTVRRLTKTAGTRKKATPARSSRSGRRG